MKYPFTRTVLTAAVMSTLSIPAHAAMSVEERMAAMEARINAVEAENATLKARLSQTDQKVEATGEAIDTLQQSGGGGTQAAAPREALGAVHSPFEHGKAGRTVVGGYGELHYNNLKGEGGASDKDEIDFHRAILFLGHQFNDDIRFFSEIEYEHANTEVGGVVELEQAYLEFDLNDRNRARAGLFLVPAGIINETHEPPAFYGVERNPIEKDIIPATWWAGGVSLLGELGYGFSYDLAVHEGLKTSAANQYKVRAGRQFTSEAVAKDPAITGRLKWTGMPGVEIAGTIQHQTNMTQSSDPTAGSANLYELHGIVNKGPFGLKALYARWNLDGNGPAAIGADKQYGWYIEPAFRINEQWGLFARYNEWDNRAGVNGNTRKQQTDFGVNYWPHPDVVLKADYQIQDNDDGKNQDGFNLGVGYQF